MNRVIYKYAVSDIDKVRIPRGYEILDCQYQNGGLYLWAIVDETTNKDKLVSLKFTILGTGWDYNLDYGYKHLKTVQNGPLVWHIFYMEY